MRSDDPVAERGDPPTRAMWPWSALIVLVAAFGVYPLVTERDSFPISDFPMFSSRRSMVEAVDTAVFVADDGTQERLSPTLIAGTDEPVSASVAVSRAINDGSGDTFCRAIAERLEGRGRPGRVEVVSETHDAAAWFAGDHEPLSRTVLAACPVVPS